VESSASEPSHAGETPGLSHHLPPGGDVDRGVVQGIHLSIGGIAAGLRNSG
jgi:hypothetical protein